MRICRWNELADPGSYSFSFDKGNDEVSGFLVRRGKLLLAYINRCPHTGVELNWQPHQFLDYQGRFIQCGTHGALFQMEDGLCVHGPCLGQSLEPLPVVEEDGDVYLRLETAK